MMWLDSQKFKGNLIDGNAMVWVSRIAIAFIDFPGNNQHPPVFATAGV